MRLASTLLAVIGAVITTVAFAQSLRIIMEEMMVPSGDAGIEIYVRNKRPADLSTFRAERTLLYVHGATYPASTAFDLQLNGMSWMDYIVGASSSMPTTSISTETSPNASTTISPVSCRERVPFLGSPDDWFKIVRQIKEFNEIKHQEIAMGVISDRKAATRYGRSARPQCHISAQHTGPDSHMILGVRF